MSDAKTVSDSDGRSGGGVARGRGVRRLKRSKATAADCIRHLFDNALLSDVTLVVGEERIPAHKVVLAARSPVFEAMFYPTSAPVKAKQETERGREGTGPSSLSASSLSLSSAEAAQTSKKNSQTDYLPDSASVSVSASVADARSGGREAEGEQEPKREREEERERERAEEAMGEEGNSRGENTLAAMERGEAEKSLREERDGGLGDNGINRGRGGRERDGEESEKAREEEKRKREKEEREQVEEAKRKARELKEVELCDTSSEALLKFLQFLYTDELEVSDQHCVQLLFLAKKFAVRPLEERCNEFFMKSVTELSVCDLLANFAHSAVMSLPSPYAHEDDDEDEHPHHSIVENLVEYVQQHSAQVLEAENFKHLSLENVKAILDTDQLNGTELQVFKAVLVWARYQCEQNDLDHNDVENIREAAKELIPLIRFPAMEQSEIAGEVRQSGLLSIEQMVELFSFMTVKEGGELSFCKSEAREKRSITYMSGDGITLPCTNEFEGGVMSYIATKGGLDAYNNPMLRGEVDVKASSWMQDADPIHFVVDRVVKRCVTRAQPMQSITIEIKRWNVRPTAYLLRHYSSWDTEALRCWVLEAATEEAGEWTVLSEHKDDTHLKAKGAWHIWPLSDVSGFYRFFRITQLGQNSNNHDYLACSGFELWGTLIHV